MNIGCRWFCLLLIAACLCGTAAAAALPMPCRAAPTPCTSPACAVPAGLLDIGDGWHGLAGCLRGLRDLWSRRGPDTPIALPGSTIAVRDLVRAQVLWEMSRQRVALLDSAGVRQPAARFLDQGGRLLRTPARIALLNDIGVPYNAMGQTGVAYFLRQFALLTDTAQSPGSASDGLLYRALSDAAAETVMAPVSDGGLASASPCALAPNLTCSWFHSITRRDRPAVHGSTLNQHLHAVRDLTLIAALVQAEKPPAARRMREAAVSGLAQLFLAGADGPPRLVDFRPAGSPGVAYYGYDPRLRKGYYLPDPARNCHYHRHAVELLDSVLTLHADRIEPGLPELSAAAYDCKGMFAEMSGMSRRGYASPSPGGPDCQATRGARLAAETRFTGCVTPPGAR